MIKVTLISLIGVGGLGLNADHLTPKSVELNAGAIVICLLYTSPSPRDQRGSRMPSSA